MTRRIIAGQARQRGVALLTAVLLVALGTVLATAIAYQSAMVARRGAATFAFEQSIAFAQGAEALAAYALREDQKSSPQEDHPGEDWAKPFGPVEVVPGVALEAVMQDLQGRFNLNILVDREGNVDPAAVAAFRKLLQMLELEPKWAALIADWIDENNEPTGFDGGEDNLYLSQVPAYRPPNRTLLSTSELLALPGFGRDRYLRLKNYITALPQDTDLNICTAPGLVLDAFMATETDEGEIQYSNAEEDLTERRQSECWPKQNQYETQVPAQTLKDRLGMKSAYFRLTSVVTVGDTQFALYSVMYREGNGARPILRTYTPD